jgi:hypothetical protein
MTMDHPNLEMLAEIFKRFATLECRGYSELYEQLSLSIAEDVELLHLASHVPPGQPLPNLFFGAVHYLLLRDPSLPLSRYYRSLEPNPVAFQEAYPAFRDFALENTEAIKLLLTTRRVQTNEVRRTAYLFLAFSLIAKLAGGQPLALIEVGASAGLNLMWDHYAYRYGDYGAFGDANAPVQIESSLQGNKRPPYPVKIPPVAYRLGIDLNPIDVRDAEEALWLRALIWPEHEERVLRLQKAIEVLKQSPPRLLAGDGVDLLPEAVLTAPDEAALCIFHTYTISQFSPEARDKFSTLIEEQATLRGELYHLSAEWLGPPHPRLELTTWAGGRKDHYLLAYCDPHGRWIEWLAD